MIQTLNKVSIEKKYFNKIMAVYHNTAAKIRLKGEEPNVFFSMISNNLGIPTLTTFIQYSTGIHSQSNNVTTQQMKGIEFRRRRRKIETLLSLFTDNNMLSPFTDNNM